MPFLMDKSGAVVVEFGEGDILCATAVAQDRPNVFEVALCDHGKYEIGSADPSCDSCRTDEIGAKVRLRFTRPESVPVLIDKLIQVLEMHNGTLNNKGQPLDTPLDAPHGAGAA